MRVWSTASSVVLTPDQRPLPEFTEVLPGERRRRHLRLEYVELTAIEGSDRRPVFSIQLGVSLRHGGTPGTPTYSLRYSGEAPSPSTYTRHLADLPEVALDLLATEPVWHHHLTHPVGGRPPGGKVVPVSATTTTRRNTP